MSYRTQRPSRGSELTIRDRINFSYILAEYEIRLGAVLDLDQDPTLNKFRALVTWLIHTIPDGWKDENFRDDMDQAQIKILEDIRPRVCGMPLSNRYCEMKKIPVLKETVLNDPFRQHQAIINLWYRRGLLSRVKYREISSGKKFDKTKKGEVFIDETDIIPELGVED